MNNNDVIKALFDKSENLEATIKNIGDKKGAKIQLQVVRGFEQLAAENGMPTGGDCTMRDLIIQSQIERVQQWGDKAYPLSDKQIAIIARELSPWQKKQ